VIVRDAVYRRPTRRRPAPPTPCSLGTSGAYRRDKGGSVAIRFSILDTEGEALGGSIELSAEDARALQAQLVEKLAWIREQEAEKVADEKAMRNLIIAHAGRTAP